MLALRGQGQQRGQVQCLKSHVKSEIKNEMKSKIQGNVKNEMKNKIKSKIRSDVKGGGQECPPYIFGELFGGGIFLWFFGD